MTASAIVFIAAFVPMLAEAAWSRRNERALRASGAIEPEEDVYPLMQVAYPACFAAMVAEGFARDRRIGISFAAGCMVFALAKALKCWAIASLGPRWTFRVLVLPGAPLVVSGPYRWLRHPNYVGVAGELLGASLMAGAPIAGVTAIVVFGGLLLARIRVEERALEARVR